MTTENILTAFLRVAENERVKDMQGNRRRMWRMSCECECKEEDREVSDER